MTKMSNGQEVPKIGSKVVRAPKVPSDLDERLQALVAATEPVQNNGWLSGMRPSQAILCCIGSGPWKIDRRAKIQQEALRILGSSDLIEKRNELASFFPLEWQKNIVVQLGRYFHLVARCPFDATGHKKVTDVLVSLEQAIGTSMYDMPKVMCMYVRDYLEHPIVPRDRHVNKRLEELSLPKNTKIITEGLIKIVGEAQVNSYARSLFENKSTNPQHTI